MVIWFAILKYTPYIISIYYDILYRFDLCIYFYEKKITLSCDKTLYISISIKNHLNNN